MTVAHLSDTHLGFRAYSRTTPAGFNQREVDVMQTFKRCLDAILARDPDVVVHAGDMFHIVRPSNSTIVKAYEHLSTFQRERRGKPFFLIGGNHETPRASDSGNILGLYRNIPGVRVIANNSEAHDVPELDLEVLAVPFQSLDRGESVDFVPSLRRKHSILTMHGMAYGLVKDHSNFDVSETRHEKWTYVALGDYHVFKPFGKNICYAGSTDFASTNLWEELKAPKGWVWFDSAKGELEHVSVFTRRVIDLDRIDAREMVPEQVELRIQEYAQWPGDEFPIVRQRVVNVHPSVRARLSQSVVREIRERSTHYHLDLVPLAVDSADSKSERSGLSLEASWESHVAQASLPAGVVRDELKDLGLELMREVGERATAPVTA